MLLLDTHVWIWWTGIGSRLRAKERAALDERAVNGELSVAAISLWEAQMLHAKGRLRPAVPFADWLSAATDDQAIAVAPLDRAVVLELDRLPARFHGDPADRLIVATARAHDLAVATYDSAIRRSRLVRLWKL